MPVRRNWYTRLNHLQVPKDYGFESRDRYEAAWRINPCEGAKGGGWLKPCHQNFGFGNSSNPEAIRSGKSAAWGVVRGIVSRNGKCWAARSTYTDEYRLWLYKTSHILFQEGCIVWNMPVKGGNHWKTAGKTFSGVLGYTMGGTKVYGNVRYRVLQKGMWPPGKHIPFNLYDNTQKTFLAETRKRPKPCHAMWSKGLFRPQGETGFVSE